MAKLGTAKRAAVVHVRTLDRLAGCAAAWGGLIWEPMRPLYDFAWFVGFGVGAAVYLALARTTRVSATATA